MKRRVLILCTANASRSQLAEILWRSLAGDRWEVFSAGTEPAGFVHPLAIQVAGERGLDLSSAQSKSTDAFLGQSFDLVLTVCGHAEEHCPRALQGATHLHWPLADPYRVKENQLQAYRETLVDLERRIRAWLATHDAWPAGDAATSPPKP